MGTETPELHSTRPVSALKGAAFAGSSWLRVLLGTGVATTVIVLGFLHRPALGVGENNLIHADREWLALAVLATAMIWVAGTVTQLGSMSLRPSLRRLFAVQIAASFTNHLLPAGSGGIAVNVRFLQRHGMSRSAALGAVGLNSLAGMVTHLILLAAMIGLAPSVLTSVGTQVRWTTWRRPVAGVAHRPWIGLALIAVLALMLVVGTVVNRRRAGTWRRTLTARLTSARTHMMRELTVLAGVVRDPARAAKLWLGSLSVPLLHAVILIAVLRAVGVPAPAGTVVVIYLIASSLSVIVPSPGGLGALDVTLATGLVAVGISSPAAIGVVLGYRLLTVWVPLMPGACVFAFLVRRRII